MNTITLTAPAHAHTGNGSATYRIVTDSVLVAFPQIDYCIAVVSVWDGQNHGYAVVSFGASSELAAVLGDPFDNSADAVAFATELAGW